MPTLSLNLPDPSAASRVTDALRPLMKHHRIFCFSGDMGSGKTTIIRQICLDLGSKDNPASPTFSIVNEYRLGSGESLYHFDLYRIESARELMNIGWDEYIHSGNLVMIEWPEKAKELIPEDAVRIRIEPTSDHSRTLTITTP